MTLRDLEYLVALADTRHFGRAAARCHVSQPTLSAQLKKLEESLGVSLVERRPRRLALTAAGEAVVQHARRMLREADDIRALARARQDPLAGSLKVGLIPTLGPYLLPRAAPKVAKALPKLQLMLHEYQTEPLIERTLAGELDLAILALPADTKGLVTRSLFREAFLVAMPVSHRLAGKKRVKATDLEDEKLLLLEEGHCLRDQALTFCQLRQVDSINTFGASSLSTIVQMVANGLGLTLLPEISVDLETRHADIRVMRFAEPEPSGTLGLAWRSTCSRKRDFVEVGRLITSVARQRPPRKAA
jgi:LysR family transcriptional regulator, hydrogen peroxide-inducible genes activator